MRLIDADSIDTRYSDPEVKETLDNAKTVKAIPLDRIEQAREEIENIGMGSYLEFIKEIECNNREVRLSKKFAIAILDKLITESEGPENEENTADN